jgi:hypothetical protein
MFKNLEELNLCETSNISDEGMLRVLGDLTTDGTVNKRHFSPDGKGKSSSSEATFLEDLLLQPLLLPLP